jgi:DNA topoisomerase-2
MTPTLSTMTTATVAASYTKLTQREHVLHRPDSYIGSKDAHAESRWVWSLETGRMGWREVQFNPGLFKIFDELIVNALDHVVRQSGVPDKSKRVSQIVITITPTQLIVMNDGEGIPVVVHPEHKVMIPELIFGHLLTSSNYDDTSEKVVGGKNGFGAKLTNIYSREFVVRTCDSKFTYEQTFSDNMLAVGKPVIKKATASTKQYTEIRSTPDIGRFFTGATAIPADMLDVLRTRVIDAAALASAHGCKVFLAMNLGEKPVAVPITSFEQYVRLFVEEGGPIFYEKAGPRWEVAAVLTRHLHTDATGIPDDRHISFVNGIFTRRGGKHVDAVSREILGGFCDGPGKKLDLKPAQLKDALTFFVNATIGNPSFDSQAKETLTTPAAKFGSKFTVSDKFIARLSKEGGLLEEAQAVLDAKLSRAAKKVDGKKTGTVRGIPKLEDALDAGSAKSSECTLILTEGDSAAAMAMAGLAEVGRRQFGVFPLRGKPLNVRGATLKEKTDNKELTFLKRILGLENGKVYKDTKSLRYGRVMIMADQDVDGSHIKGLLINMFDAEWPALLQMNFLCGLMTPLLKMTKGPVTKCFYSASEYEKFIATPIGAMSGWHVKYYKGLGTSTAAEAREYFRDMTLVRFVQDADSREYIDMAFNDDRADDRKSWLDTYDRSRVLEVPTGGVDVSYTKFINDELIHFSIADNLRSIPHVMDGLKPSQRKILWAARKRNLVGEIKVAQLAGYVSENAAYHHGEVSLTEAIIGLAQNFVGSNNINLLMPNGQFGTRLEGGKDSAAARYIFTALSPIQGTLLSKADDPALRWLEDDGQRVEPDYYMPVLPLLLVNGADGIGTGYSSKVLSYSPKDLVASLRSRLSGSVADLSTTVLSPWYDGFRGPVSVATDAKTTKVTTKGLYEFFDDEGCRVRITELPVGVWTKRYKEFLEKMLESDAKEPATKGKKKGDGDSVSVASASVKMLRSFQEAYTDVAVEFVLTLDPSYYHEARTFPAEFEKKFRLTKSTTLSNMVAFDVDGRLKRFGSVGSILETFYVRRIGGYVTRKANELARLDAEAAELDARVRFVRAVVDGSLVVMKVKKEVLFEAMTAMGLPKKEGDYRYLTKTPVEELTEEEIAKLEAKLAAVKEARAALEALSPESLWLSDLEAFESAYETFCGQRAAAKASGPVKKVVAKKAAKAKA